MEPDIESVRAEVQCKIGRNVVALQQIEAMLNFLAAYGDEVMVEDPQIEDDAALTEFQRWRKRLLVLLVKDRQDLTLQLLQRFNWSERESLLAAGEWLDQRLAALKPDMEVLEQRVQAQKVAVQAWVKRLDGMSIGDLRQEHAELLKVLDDQARMTPGPEAWVPLFDVEHRLSRAMPREMAALEDTYGSRSLLSLIRSSGLFEVRADVSLSKPEFHYRLKAR